MSPSPSSRTLFSQTGGRRIGSSVVVNKSSGLDEPGTIAIASRQREGCLNALAVGLLGYPPSTQNVMGFKVVVHKTSSTCPKHFILFFLPRYSTLRFFREGGYGLDFFSFWLTFFCFFSMAFFTALLPPSAASASYRACINSSRLSAISTHQQAISPPW